MFKNEISDGCFNVREAYKNAFSRFQSDGVIDIDQRLKIKFDFCVSRIEDMVSAVHGIMPPSRQKGHYIVLINEGSGKKNIGDFSFDIKDNTFFFVPNRVIHSSIYNQTKCSGYVLIFDIDFFLKTDVPKNCIGNRKIFRNSSRPYLYLEPAQADALSLIFELMLQEHGMNIAERQQMIAVKILELLVTCDHFFTRAGLTGENVIYHPLIERFNDLLDCKFRNYRNVQFYADSLNVHPNHLNVLLKRYNGHNAKQYINNKIISESKYLLSNSDFIIKEVANRLGFDDPNNFSTFFQKCTGNSPVTYRKLFNTSHAAKN